MRAGARAGTSGSAAAGTPRGGDPPAGRPDGDSPKIALTAPPARTLPPDVDVWISEPTS
jgi:hypothetical protein